MDPLYGTCCISPFWHLEFLVVVSRCLEILSASVLKFRLKLSQNSEWMMFRRMYKFALFTFIAYVCASLISTTIRLFHGEEFL